MRISSARLRHRQANLSFRQASRGNLLEQRPVPVEEVEMPQLRRRHPADILKDTVRDRPAILVDAKKHQIELSTAGIAVAIAKNFSGFRDVDIKLFFQLSEQRVLDRFPRFYLSSGEFPFRGKRAALSLTDENTPVADDQRRNDPNRFQITAPPLSPEVPVSTLDSCRA
jgi:hypothetical protein